MSTPTAESGETESGRRNADPTGSMRNGRGMSSSLCEITGLSREGASGRRRLPLFGPLLWRLPPSSHA